MSDLSMCGQELEGGRESSIIRSAAVSGARICGFYWEELVKVAEPIIL